MRFSFLLQPFKFLWFFFLVTTVWAQLGPFNPTGFNFVGRINAMTLNSGGNPLAGGTIVVNGITITVPENTLVTLPSIAVAWSELFTQSGQPNLPQFGQTSWDVNLFGNIVNDQYIAGLIFIAQDATQLLQGVITAIDMDTGIFTVGKTSASPANAGWKLRLNDPLGVFGKPFTDHPLWTVDPVSPSVRSNSGVPLCIPRNATDPLCPLTNRPKDAAGHYLTTFQFGNPATLAPGVPDPRIMVPLSVGDYLTFSGTDVGGGLIAVYSLLANLGITTAPGTKPVYVTVEELQYGVVDNQGGEVAETKAVAYTSDPTTPIQWFSQDVDPCTGKIKERNLQLVAPGLDDPPGKTVYRLRKTDASPVVRNVGFRSVTGTMTVSQGIVAGEFIQPVFDFIFPEITNFGSPPLINSFDVIPFLARGSGPYVPGNFLAPPQNTTVIVGQLKPFPALNPPVPLDCPPPTPTDPGNSTSSTVSSSTTPPPSQTPTQDFVTIISVTTGGNSGGITPVTVVAQSTNTLGTAKLTLTLTGDSTVSAPMNNFGGGTYSLTISIKHPTLATVSSDGGGIASAVIKR